MSPLERTMAVWKDLQFYFQEYLEKPSDSRKENLDRMLGDYLKGALDGTLKLPTISRPDNSPSVRYEQVNQPSTNHKWNQLKD